MDWSKLTTIEDFFKVPGLVEYGRIAEEDNLFDDEQLLLRNKGITTMCLLVEQPSTCGSVFIHNISDPGRTGEFVDQTKAMLRCALLLAERHGYTNAHISHTSENIEKILLEIGFKEVRSYTNQRTANVITDYIYEDL